MQMVKQNIFQINLYSNIEDMNKFNYASISRMLLSPWVPYVLFTFAASTKVKRKGFILGSKHIKLKCFLFIF